MPQVIDSGHPPAELSAPGHVRKRPVILATLSVRVDPNAERVALESALETGTNLIVANMLPLQAYPMTYILAPDQLTLPHEEDLEAVRATAQRAAEQGIPTELLRITSRRPLFWPPPGMLRTRIAQPDGAPPAASPVLVCMSMQCRRWD